jgi:hypothetical protein
MGSSITALEGIAGAGIEPGWPFGPRDSKSVRAVPPHRSIIRQLANTRCLAYDRGRAVTTANERNHPRTKPQPMGSIQVGCADDSSKEPQSSAVGVHRWFEPTLHGSSATVFGGEVGPLNAMPGC